MSQFRLLHNPFREPPNLLELRKTRLLPFPHQHTLIKIYNLEIDVIYQ